MTIDEAVRLVRDTGTDGWQCRSLIRRLHVAGSILADRCEALQAAIDAGGMDVSPCYLCGTPTVTAPDGIAALCVGCANKESNDDH